MAGCVYYKKEIVARNDSFFLKDQKIKERANMFGNFTDDCGLDSYWEELTGSTKKAVRTMYNLYLYLGK